MSYQSKKQTEKEVKKLKTYLNRIGKARLKTDTGTFLEQNSALIEQLKTSKTASYILDIKTMHYIFLNDNYHRLTRYDTQTLINTDWKYPMDSVVREDRLYVCVVLQEWYALLPLLSEEDKKNATLALTYRMETLNKETMKVMQESEIIAWDANGAPTLEMGNIKNIQFTKPNNKVIGSVSLTNETITLDPFEIDNRLKPYSDKELKILHYVSEGDSNQEIADKTGDTTDNIELIRKNHIKKADGKNLINAIYKGIKRGDLD